MSNCTFASVLDHANGHDVGYRCTLKEGHQGEHHIFDPITTSGTVKDLGGKLFGIRQLERALLEQGWKVGSHDLCNLARIGRIPCALYVPNRPSESLWRTADIAETIRWFETEWKGERRPPSNGPLVDRDGVLAMCNFSRSALEYWHLRDHLKPVAYLRLGRGRPTPVWTVEQVSAFNEKRLAETAAS